MAELVGVHGIAKHQLGRHQLVSSWAPALADGLERAVGMRIRVPELDVAFYGDLFLPGDGGTTKSGDAREVLDGLSAEELAEVTAALGDAVGPADVAAAEQEVPKGYTRVPRPVQVLLRAVDRRFGAAAGILYVGVVRQVRRYLSVPEDKAAVDARVEAAVAADCQVLIGHSLGSVVAYEYLRRHPDHRVRLFLTVGSPLGLRMVRSRLDGGAVVVPEWVNVRDLRDPVACAGPLREWWPQIGTAGELIVDNGGDTHAVERYLSRRATGEILLRALPRLATT